MPPRLLLSAVAFVALVHAVAGFGAGLLRSPLPRGWDATTMAEAPPLARFDAGWYRSIAKDGYFWDPATGAGNIAFFPLFPALMRGVSMLGVPLFWSGLLLAHGFFAVSFVALHRHATREWGGPSAAADATVALVAFPWAFFLLAPYSESLFLALALGVFHTARKQRWALAGTLGVLAGLTRPFGLALVPALLVSVRPTLRDLSVSRLRRLGALLATLGPALGTGAFMLFLGIRFRDPLAFVHAQQKGWSRGASFSGVTGALGAVIHNLRSHGLLHLGPAVDLLVLALLAGTAVWAWRQRAHEEALYVAAGTALILLSGSLLSDGRYALVLFPVMRCLSRAAPRRPLRVALVALSALLQGYLIVRFVNDLWVA